VVVDFSCPDGTGEWIGKHHPEVSLAKCEKRKYFRGAEARNLGATAIPEDGLICFLDADVVAGPEFSSHVLSRFTPGSFFVPDRDGPGLRTALVCSKGDFDKAGGFDEGFIDWGEEVTDLRASLCRIGLKEQTFPASLLSHQPQHRQAPSYSTISDRRKALEIHAAYRRVKSAATSACPDLCSLQTAMNEFDNALQAEKLATGATPCAAIAFHENMGYTIARLEAGATSHNNVERPFAAVPRALEGHRYTQVVAYSASPVEVKFLSAGKLYVLVGTDWDGHSVATAWLRSVGQREMMPPLLTRRQTGFEVWSLTGETGDRHVLPTQVMLVANSLDKV